MSSSAFRPLPVLTLDELIAQRDDALRDYAALVQRGLSLDLTRGKPSPRQLDLANACSPCPRPTRPRTAPTAATTAVSRACRELREIFAAVAAGARRPAGRRRQLQPRADARHHRARAARQAARRPSAAGRTSRRSRSSARCPGTTGTSRSASGSASSMIPVPMTDDGPDMDVVERLVAEDAERQGHLVRAEVQQPDRRSTTATRPCGGWPPCPRPRRTSGSSGTTPTPCTTSPTRRAEIADVLWRCARSTATRPGLRLRVHVEDHFRRRRASRSSGRRPANVPGSSATPPSAPSGRTRSTSSGTCEFLRDADGRRRAHAQARRADPAQVRARSTRSSPRSSAAPVWRPGPSPRAATSSASTCRRAAPRGGGRAAGAGIALTPAGATHPYGNDPRDSTIRIAPTYPELDEVERPSRAWPPACASSGPRSCWSRPASRMGQGPGAGADPGRPTRPRQARLTGPTRLWAGL